MELQTLAKNMEPVIRRAGEYIRKAVPQNIREKSGYRDLVTEYDENTQRMLVSELSLLHPKAAFLGEEEGLKADVSTGDCFVIDPIDGTANFVAGFNRSCISVALLREGKPVIGVIYNPWAEEYYVAIRGMGTTVNGTPLQIRPRSLKEGLVSLGTAPYYPDLMQRTFRICAQVANVAPDIRRTGTATQDFCDIAMNRTVAFFELRLSPWDFAAGALIVTEAGGEITDIDGNEIPFGVPSSIVAGAPLARKELAELIRRVP